MAIDPVAFIVTCALFGFGYLAIGVVRINIGFAFRRRLVDEEAEWLVEHYGSCHEGFKRDANQVEDYNDYWINRPWLTLTDYKEAIKPVEEFYK